MNLEIEATSSHRLQLSRFTSKVLTFWGFYARAHLGLRYCRYRRSGDRLSLTGDSALDCIWLVRISVGSRATLT